MTVKDLINSCQNQWEGLLGYNKKFEIEIIDEIEQTKKRYKWVELKDSDIYLLKLRKREVEYWEILNNNLIQIDIK